MNERISTYYQSPLGSLKITGTNEFLSEVSFCNTEQPTEANVETATMVMQCVNQLTQFFNGELKEFNLVLAQSGTPFQQEVWKLLYQIPFGKTISYMDLAKQIGDPKATRAVANANGKNNIAIIVPCHRVIGSDRTLTGYAGGLWRKKWLLEHEAKLAHGVQVLF